MRNLIISKLDSDRLRDRLLNIKNKTGKLNPELGLLLGELDKAELVEPESMPDDVITMNSKVKVKLSNNDKTMEFQIVYPEKADMKKGRISIFAPVATALLGYRKGDRVKWQVPSGEVTITIEDILYQPEAAGEYEL